MSLRPRHAIPRLEKCTPAPARTPETQGLEPHFRARPHPPSPVLQLCPQPAQDWSGYRAGRRLRPAPAGRARALIHTRALTVTRVRRPLSPTSPPGRSPSPGRGAPVALTCTVTAAGPAGSAGWGPRGCVQRLPRTRVGELSASPSPPLPRQRARMRTGGRTSGLHAPGTCTPTPPLRISPGCFGS